MVGIIFIAAVICIAVCLAISLIRIRIVFKFRMREIDRIYDRRHPIELYTLYHDRWDKTSFDQMTADWKKWTYEQFFPEIEYNYHEPEFWELSWYIKQRQKRQTRIGHPLLHKVPYQDLTKREKKLFDALKEHFECTETSVGMEYRVTDKIYPRWEFSGYMLIVVV